MTDLEGPTKPDLAYPLREETGLRWRSRESSQEEDGSFSEKNSAKGKKPRRSLLGALLQRNKCSITILCICVLILIHGILTAVNRPPPGMVRLETLESLAKASMAGSFPGMVAKKSSSLYLFGGVPISDSTDWLDPEHLGLQSVHRARDGLGGLAFDPSLWDPKLIDSDGLPRQPLSTSAWWIPFVIPPGSGPVHVVNSCPYLLSVRSKPKGRTDLVGDTAGLTVRLNLPSSALFCHRALVPQFMLLPYHARSPLRELLEMQESECGSLR
ncbi:hypothetical protein cyc_04927 [Cyclospora cayetanensis]|uniref:Uncharacterized protein n=1 Tax=Cyclospora cayetanensis TaxID=88456 RepID=A0A1D3D4C9_9EIME|nr:hypothetical protein cyc_04927 [Cyclospora cayetanensis]